MKQTQKSKFAVNTDDQSFDGNQISKSLVVPSKTKQTFRFNSTNLEDYHPQLPTDPPQIEADRSNSRSSKSYNSFKSQQEIDDSENKQMSKQEKPQLQNQVPSIVSMPLNTSALNKDDCGSINDLQVSKEQIAQTQRVRGKLPIIRESEEFKNLNELKRLEKEHLTKQKQLHLSDFRPKEAPKIIIEEQIGESEEICQNKIYQHDEYNTKEKALQYQPKRVLTNQIKTSEIQPSVQATDGDLDIQSKFEKIYNSDINFASGPQSGKRSLSSSNSKMSAFSGYNFGQQQAIAQHKAKKEQFISKDGNASEKMSSFNQQRHRNKSSFHSKQQSNQDEAQQTRSFGIENQTNFRSKESNQSSFGNYRMQRTSGLASSAKSQSQMHLTDSCNSQRINRFEKQQYKMENPINTFQQQESIQSGRQDSFASRSKDSSYFPQMILSGHEKSISGLLNQERQLESTMTKNPLNLTMARRMDSKQNKRDLDALDLVYSDTNKDFQLQREIQSESSNLNVKSTDKMVLQTNKNKMIDNIVQSLLKNIDRTFDISEMGARVQVAKQMDSTHSNLLKYSSGFEFRNINKMIEAKRRFSTFVQHQDIPDKLNSTIKQIEQNQMLGVQHKSLHNTLTNLDFYKKSVHATPQLQKRSLIADLTPVQVPKPRGLGHGGHSNMLSSQMNMTMHARDQQQSAVHQVKKEPIKQDTEIDLAAAGFAVPLTQEQENRFKEVEEERLQRQGELLQKQIIDDMQAQVNEIKDMHNRIQDSQNYLKMLRSRRSAERVKLPIQKRMKDKRKNSFCQLFFHEDIACQNMPQNQIKEKATDSLTSYKDLRSNFRKRQRSEGQLDFVGMLHDFRSKMSQDKNQANYELLEIRSIIQQMLKGVPNIGYYSVILQNTSEMIIDRFIDLQINDFQKIKQLKDIINKFEQLKRDLNRKISLAFKNEISSSNTKEKNSSKNTGNSNSQTDPNSFETGFDQLQSNYSLSKLEISNLLWIFAQIKDIITIFSRKINYVDRMHKGYKKFLMKIEIKNDVSRIGSFKQLFNDTQTSFETIKKFSNEPASQKNVQFSVNKNPQSKLPPQVKKIMQEQRLEQRKDFNNYEPVLKSGDNSDVQHHDSDSSIDNIIINDAKFNRLRAHSLMPTVGGTQDQFESSHLLNIQDIYTEYPMDERARIVITYNVTLTHKWKQSYDSDRQKNCAIVTCRMCFRSFYADKHENHNKFCQLKREKALSQKVLNGEFNFLSNEATQMKVKLDKQLYNMMNKLNAPLIYSGEHSSSSKVKVTPRVKKNSPSVVDSNSLKQSKKNNQIQEQYILVDQSIKSSQQIKAKEKVSPKDSIADYQHFSLKKQHKVPTLNFQNLDQFEEKQEQSKIQQQQNNQQQQILQKPKMYESKKSEKKLEIIQEESFKQSIQLANDAFIKRGEHEQQLYKEKLINSYKQIAFNQMQSMENGQMPRSKKRLLIYELYLKKGKKYNQTRHPMPFDQNNKSVKRYRDKSNLKRKFNTNKRKNIKKSNEINKKSISKSARIDDMEAGENSDIQKELDPSYLTKDSFDVITDTIQNQKNTDNAFQLKNQNKNQLKNYIDNKKLHLPAKRDSALIKEASNDSEHGYFAQVEKISELNQYSNKRKKEANYKASSNKQSQHALIAQLNEEVSSDIHEKRMSLLNQIQMVDIMKVLAQNCSEMSRINHSFKQQANILSQHQQNLQSFMQNRESIQISDNVHQFIQKFNKTIEKKIKILHQMQDVEQEYIKTLPLSEIESFKQSLKQYGTHFERFKNTAVSTTILQMELTQNRNRDDFYNCNGQMRNNSLSYVDSRSFPNNISLQDYHKSRRMTIIGGYKSNSNQKKLPFPFKTPQSQLSMFASDVDSISNFNSSRFDQIVDKTQNMISSSMQQNSGFNQSNASVKSPFEGQNLSSNSTASPQLRFASDQQVSQQLTGLGLQKQKQYKHSQFRRKVPQIKLSAQSLQSDKKLVRIKQKSEQHQYDDSSPQPSSAISKSLLGHAQTQQFMTCFSDAMSENNSLVRQIQDEEEHVEKRINDGQNNEESGVKESRGVNKSVLTQDQTLSSKKSNQIQPKRSKQFERSQFNKVTQNKNYQDDKKHDDEDNSSDAHSSSSKAASENKTGEVPSQKNVKKQTHNEMEDTIQLPNLDQIDDSVPLSSKIDQMSLHTDKSKQKKSRGLSICYSTILTLQQKYNTELKAQKVEIQDSQNSVSNSGEADSCNFNDDQREFSIMSPHNIPNMKSHNLPSNKMSPCHNIPHGQSTMSIYTLNEVDYTNQAKQSDSLIHLPQQPRRYMKPMPRQQKRPNNKQVSQYQEKQSDQQQKKKNNQ